MALLVTGNHTYQRLASLRDTVDSMQCKISTDYMQAAWDLIHTHAWSPEGYADPVLSI